FTLDFSLTRESLVIILLTCQVEVFRTPNGSWVQGNVRMVVDGNAFHERYVYVDTGGAISSNIGMGSSITIAHSTILSSGNHTVKGQFRVVSPNTSITTKDGEIMVVILKR